ncbi:MAG: hypothetical protein D6706_14880, partial [Chloroflexi bacterium]
MWQKFRKKPVVIEAYQWSDLSDIPELVKPFTDNKVGTCKHCNKLLEHHGAIETLEGVHIVCPGDWIVKGVAGEYYP